MSKPRHWKRRFKRLGLGLLGLIALLLLINLILNVWASSKLEAKLQKIRDEGAPVCIADLAPQPIPPAQNAAVHLQNMYPELKRFEKAMVVFEERTPLGKAYVQRSDEYEGALPTAEQAAAMQAILDDYSDLFLAVDQLVACNQYASQFDFSLDFYDFLDQMFKQGSPIRSVARFLSWEMQVLAVQGKKEQAVETGIHLLRLARLHDAEPLLVNALIGFACRYNAAYRLNQVLQSGSIAAKTRDALDEELAKHDDPHGFAKMLLTERAGSLDAMEDWKIAPVPIHWHFTFWQSDLLDWYDEQLDWAELPWYQAKDQLGKVDESKYSNFIQLMSPATQSAHVAFTGNIAMLRCLRILNAAGAFHDKNDRQPTVLDDLELPAEATLDPFNGKPLVFHATEAGWLIYSVSQNGTDDGGDFKEQHDWGLAPNPLSASGHQSLGP